MAHQKHAFVTKPQGGKFHRNEMAFLGAPCGDIQRLTSALASELTLDLGYVDADHGDGGQAPDFGTTYTDKISHHQFEFDHQDYTYRFRQLFNDKDGILVNGNHFLAARQIVIINDKKEESLNRKLDRLTQVEAFILDEGMSQPFEFLKSLPEYEKIPILHIHDIAKIAQVVKASFLLVPPIKGLVLAGGKSTRMGRDKGGITYHGKPQREHMADLLSQLCDKTFISAATKDAFDSEYPLIADTFLDLGPYGGILSAFRQDPNAAWFTVACDVPLLNSETLHRLIRERDPSKLATCFHNEETQFPEPLITLWEPRAYTHLLQFLALGYSCPRKVLINSEVKALAVDQHLLKNVNTPDEYDAIRSLVDG